MAGSKLCEVTDINFSDLTLEARESDLSVGDVPENEIFRLEEFGEFKVTLRNVGGNVIDFREWVEGHGNRKF